MKTKSLAVVFVLLGSACVDRVDIDYDAQTFRLVVDGFISDQPGPYTVRLSQSFDIQSKASVYLPLSASRVVISDNLGNSERLFETVRGTFVTRADGIRGIAGRAYSVRVEFGSSLTFASRPDTLYPTGTVEKVYFQFRTDPTDEYVAGQGSTKHSFDVFFDASAGVARNYRMLWKFTGTYKVNIACCACWVPLSNDEPIVSDDKLVSDGRFVGVLASNVPVTGYTFLYKVYAGVEQRSLSRQAYDFWRAIKAQKEGTSSLFQPVAGKIPTNLFQVSGQPSGVDGIFYATSTSSNAVYITPSDVPNPAFIPKLEFASGSAILNPGYKCPTIFPNSTPVRPAYWED